MQKNREEYCSLYPNELKRREAAREQNSIVTDSSLRIGVHSSLKMCFILSPVSKRKK